MEPIDEVAQFVSDTLYARPYEIDAITLFLAATHVYREMTTFPRLLVTGPSGSGKTTVLRIARFLAFNAEDCSGATVPGLRSAFNDARDTGLSLLVDEVDVIFGPSGLRGAAHQLRTIACRGYEEDATIRFSASQSSVKVPIYAPAFLAGIGEHCVPDDLLTRCVHVSMAPKPHTIKKSNPGSPAWKIHAQWLAEPLHAQMRSLATQVKEQFPLYESFGPKLQSRTGEIWGGMFTVARILGGTWPSRCLSAFERMATDEGGSARDRQPRQVQLLLDMADIFRTQGDNYIPVREIAEGLMRVSEVYRALAGKRLYMLMTSATGTQASRVHVPGSDNETMVVRYAADCVPAADKILADMYPAAAEEEEGDIELG